MSDALLRLYHQMPAPLRSAAATARGFYLRSWRYGPDTERVMAETVEREHWSAARWENWRAERMALVLHRAATRVPYYREEWAARRRRGDRSSWEYLENWPILDKDTLRTEARRFVADDCDLKRLYHEHTSGTTGKSVSLWKSRATVQTLYAISEVRERGWYGVSTKDRWAMLGGQLVTPVAARRPPFWVWNRALNQLYMSSYHLAPDLIPDYVRALRRYKISYLWGYTSSLYALAQQVLCGGGSDLQMKVAIANAEPVFAYQREAIEEAFRCPVRETYGMSENVAAATECQGGRLHLWPEIGTVEVLGDEREQRETGDLICTGLLNADMPLIRYRVGDRGALLGDEAGNCSCGRTLPALAAVEGRSDDVLYTRDGRLIGRLDPVFKADLPVREAQVIQETLSRLRVRYVPATGFRSADAESIVERLRDRMGDIEVVLEELAEVPRTSNGKFRAVICNLSPVERGAVGKLRQDDTLRLAR